MEKKINEKRPTSQKINRTQILMSFLGNFWTMRRLKWGGQKSSRTLTTKKFMTLKMLSDFFFGFGEIFWASSQPFFALHHPFEFDVIVSFSQSGLSLSEKI